MCIRDRIRTDAASGAQSPGDRTNSGFHQRTLPMGRTFMTIARGALPLRGGHMRLRLRAFVLRLHSCGVFAFSNILLLRHNLEPSAADRNVSPSLHIRDARYGTTYIHTSPGSPGRLALRLEHVDHDDLVDVVACVRVDLGHVRACVTSSSS